MKRQIVVVLLPVLILGIAAADGYASVQDIKQRMIERLPIIKTLKAAGLVGENNRGYLEFIGKKKAHEDVIAAENADRRLVYEAIAKQQGTKMEVVEKHRAAQISARAEPGEWLQDANGKWYRK